MLVVLQQRAHRARLTSERRAQPKLTDTLLELLVSHLGNAAPFSRELFRHERCDDAEVAARIGNTNPR